jgi:uncharacterized protein
MLTARSVAVGVNLALVLMVIVSQPAQASPATESRQELAVRELIRNQITPEYLETIYVDAASQASTQFQASIQPTLGRALFDDEKERLYAFWYRKVREMIPYESLEKILVPVFSRYFSLEELEEINQFYSTPVGRRLIELTPTLSREGGNAGRMLASKLTSSNEWMSSMLAELRAEFPYWFPNQ